MHAPSVIKISKGDLRGLLAAEVVEGLPPAFYDDPVSAFEGMGASVIKRSRLRWAAIATLPSGRRMFLKRDRSKGWPEGLKYLLLPSKARKEWALARRSETRDLCIPKPLGWLERVRNGLVTESYYASSAVGSGISLMEEPDLLMTSEFISGFAETVKGIHRKGLFHKDFHAGNFLWDGRALFLVDLHRARLTAGLSRNQRLWNLAQLFFSLKDLWREEERNRFLREYFEEDRLLPENLLRIGEWVNGLQRAQWRSRARRCLKESTEFGRHRDPERVCYHRKGFPLDAMMRLVDLHRREVRENPGSLVKNSPKVIVSILEEGKRKICVKQFLYPAAWDTLKERFRDSRGLKAWVAGNSLRTRGIQGPTMLGLMERRDGFGLRESLLIMEAIEEGQELDRFLLKGFRSLQEKRDFIRSFAVWLSSVHQKGLYHRDMKSCNLMVLEKAGNWGFLLLDLEDIRFEETVGERRLFRNLLQLNTSTPRAIRLTDRYRFFKEYLKRNPIVENRRLFLKHLHEESRKRGLVYVSPEGVVVETW